MKNDNKFLPTSQFRNLIDICDGVFMGSLLLQFASFLVGNLGAEISFFYNLLSFLAVNALRIKDN